MGFIKSTTMLDRLGKVAYKCLGNKTSAERMDMVNSAKKTVRIVCIAIVVCCYPLFVIGILNLFGGVHPPTFFFACLAYITSIMMLDNKSRGTTNSKALMKHAKNALSYSKVALICTLVGITYTMTHICMQPLGTGKSHNDFIGCLVGCTAGAMLGSLTLLAYGTLDLVHSSVLRKEEKEKQSAKSQ